MWFERKKNICPNYKLPIFSQLSYATSWVTVRNMIISFRHKGLKKFYASGDKSGIMAIHVSKLRCVLSDLDVATNDEDLNSPAYKLHVLQGNREGVRSINVQKNWRITFKWIGSNVELVNYEDYH